MIWITQLQILFSLVLKVLMWSNHTSRFQFQIIKVIILGDTVWSIILDCKNWVEVYLSNHENVFWTLKRLSFTDSHSTFLLEFLQTLIGLDKMLACSYLSFRKSICELTHLNGPHFSFSFRFFACLLICLFSQKHLKSHAITSCC